jgi:iron complex outermembrane receptor protein
VGGLEAELATAPLGRLGASAALAYTFLATRTLRGTPEEVGKDVPRRPRHRLFARAGVAPGPLELHAEAHLVSRQWLDMRNAVAVPAALTFHAGASLRLWRRPEVRLHLEVRNLGDDRTLQDTFGNPLPGRMVLVALRVASRGPDRPGGER